MKKTLCISNSAISSGTEIEPEF